MWVRKRVVPSLRGFKALVHAITLVCPVVAPNVALALPISRFIKNTRCFATSLDMRVAGAQPRVAIGAAQIRQSADSTVALYWWGSVTCRFAGSADRMSISLKVENRTQSIINRLGLHVMDLNPLPPGASAAPVLRPKKSKEGLEGPEFLTIPYPKTTIIIANREVGKLVELSAHLAAGVLSVDIATASNAILLPLEERTRARYQFKARVEPVGRPIPPLRSADYLLLLGAVPTGASPAQLLGGILAGYSQLYPSNFNWPDRRPIGELILSGHTKNSPLNPGNPRYYVRLSPGVDVNLPAGREEVHRLLLKTAKESIGIMKAMRAQGVIVWDLEGEQYLPPVSYLGDPRKLPPEVANVADQFYKSFTDAGLRCGMTLRPQRLMSLPSGEMYQQNSDQDAVVVASLDQKIKYAKQRWGCTLFYIDSNGDANWSMPVSIFRTVISHNPGILLIPEASTIAYYASTAPYCTKVTDCGSELARMVYPRAFGVLSVNLLPVEPQGMTQKLLDELVRSGDILAFPAWYNDPRNLMVLHAYQQQPGSMH